MSGGGTTLQNLIDRIARGSSGQVVQVIASRPGIGAIAKAGAGIPLALATRRQEAGDFSRSVFDPIRQSGPTSSCWAGSSRSSTIPPDYAGRVMNIHPALIPAFCGKGYHGPAVHQAVIDRA